MRFRSLAVILFLLSSSSGFTQPHVADSLETLVSAAPADTTKVLLLNRLVSSLRENNTNKAYTYAVEARKLAEALNYERGKAVALENLGWIFYRKGDYSAAFQHSTTALKITEAVGDPSGLARCLNNIAAILFEQKQYQHAMENLRKAYMVSEQVSDLTSMARSLNNMAYSYLRINKSDSALLFAQRALKLSEQNNIHYHLGFALRTLGDIDYANTDYDAARIKFERLVDLAKTLNNIFLQVSTLHRLGNTYAKLEQLDKAIGYLNVNITLAQQAGYKEELERSYKVLSELYVQKKDIAKAFDYQSKYLSLHDSLYDQRSSEQMALIQTRFETEMKEAEIELLTKDTLLKQEEINHQRVWMYFYLGCSSLLLILAFVLFYSIRVRTRANERLERKRNEIQEQAQQLSNLNITKDKLFSIISHDLRSPLASLKGLMNLVVSGNLNQEEFREVSKKLKNNLDTVNQDLDNLLLWAQSQLKGFQVNAERVRLRAVFEEKINLFKALAQTKELTILNEVEDDLVIFADKNHIALVIRNLLTNAIKFNKKGGLIHIRQKESGNKVEISVSDSGVGMEADDLKRLFNAETHFTHPGTSQEKGTGIGLLLTKEFIEKNGGTISVTSEPGKGSTFTFTLTRDLSRINTVLV